MNSERILSLLGLALRGGNLVVGEEPVEAVARARDARVLLMASDAAANTHRRCARFAEMGQCLFLTLPCTKAELGQNLGRSSVALVAVTDVGLANAVVQRLAELDSEKYGHAAQRLELKARRAAERRSEQLAHEKNLRAGKKKRRSAPAVEAEVAAPAEKKAAAAKKPGSEKAAPGKRHSAPHGKGPSRPSKENRPKGRSRTNPYAHSRPVKKGKGSFRKKED